MPEVVVPAWVEICMDIASANATEPGTGASNFRIIRVRRPLRLGRCGAFLCPETPNKASPLSRGFESP